MFLPIHTASHFNPHLVVYQPWELAEWHPSEDWIHSTEIPDFYAIYYVSVLRKIDIHLRRVFNCLSGRENLDKTLSASLNRCYLSRNFALVSPLEAQQLPESIFSDFNININIQLKQNVKNKHAMSFIKISKKKDLWFD